MKGRYAVWELHPAPDIGVAAGSRESRLRGGAGVSYALFPCERPPEVGPGRAVPVSPALPLGYAEWVARELERAKGAAPAGGRGLLERIVRGPFGRLFRRLFGLLFERSFRPGAAARRRVRRILRRFAELEGVPLPWPGPPAAGDTASGPGIGGIRARGDTRTGEGAGIARGPSGEGACGGANTGRAEEWGGAGPVEEALVLRALEGRNLLSGEVRRALEELGHLVGGPVDVYLDPWVQAGLIERTAAVGWDESAGPAGGWRCRRCLSDRVVLAPCLTCGSERCPQCASCSSLGVSSACAALYHRRAAPVALSAPLGTGRDGSRTAEDVSAGECARAKSVRVCLPFELSPRQAELSAALRGAKGDALIWAACGAGKTEVTYGAIADVIGRGGRVLFSVPRRDVVEQLGERLQSVFEGVDVVALHGDTPLKYARSELVVATAHQAVRFRECFDLLVVDEVDAFPLSREAWLMRALDRTLRPGGRRILMTATPLESLALRAELGEIETHVLPERPHGHPLPVPKVVHWGRRQRDRLATTVEWIERSLAAGRKVILFVPTVAKGYELSAEVGARVRARIAYVHAGRRDRSEKLKGAEAGEIDILVSTTVLERGVTIPRVDVVVAEADDERVFDAAALIQMAGRSGRRLDDPHGSAVFLAGRITPAIRLAVATVERLNAIAAQQKVRLGGASRPP